jgi:hypothetical protein
VAFSLVKVSVVSPLKILLAEMIQNEKNIFYICINMEQLMASYLSVVDFLQEEYAYQELPQKSIYLFKFKTSFIFLRNKSDESQMC